MKSIALTALLVFGSATVQSAVVLPEKLPPHPRLLLSQRDIPAIRQRIETQAWARKRFEALRAQADGWLKREVKLPDRGGQWYHYYSCPKHGARLRNEGPARHVCPIDKEVFTGQPYDDVALMGVHDGLADGVRALGIVYQLTQDPRYAQKAGEILLAYAGKYQEYPLHTIRGEAKVGGGKVGPQTLDESTWLIDIVEGADCLWDTLPAGDQQQIIGGLLRPATEVIRQHKMGIHNIQCWKNSAVGLTGLLIGDFKLVDEALNAGNGYFQQMAKGVSADGPWYEGAWGYHFYTVSAVTHLTEGAWHSGIDLYGPDFKRMFDAPLAMCMPDFGLPAFNDSHAVSLLGQTSLFEVAQARYRDNRYAALLARSNRSSDYGLLCGATNLSKGAEFSPKSVNFEAAGNAILAAGEGPDATWLCLDYGPHGGGHGHPDKLGFVLYGLGRVLAPDPGTANYGVPIQAGWYRTTLAHNTLTLDEESQKAAQGRCVAFVAGDGFSAILAEAGKIYGGVAFHRTVALIGRDLLVFIDQIRADKEHTFDVAYHNVGRFAAVPAAAPAEWPKKPGYSYLRDTQSVASADGLELNFDVGTGAALRWSMAPGSQTTYLLGTGVGAHTEDRVPVVIARRRGREAAYIWAVSLSSETRALALRQEPIKLAAESGPSAPEPVAARVRVGDVTHVVVANPALESLLVADQKVGAPLIHLSSFGNGPLRIVHAAR